MMQCVNPGYSPVPYRVAVLKYRISIQINMYVYNSKECVKNFKKYVDGSLPSKLKATITLHCRNKIRNEDDASSLRTMDAILTCFRVE